MTWRYQPVWVEDETGLRHYHLAWVCVESDGSLVNWSHGLDDARGATTIARLTERIARMLMDANLYKPVAFSTLKAGMVFERVDE